MYYLETNARHWSKYYLATNVDHPVFRFYGRILQPEFKLGGNWERLVDFGCAQGAAVNFFRQMGFNAHGVDINKKDIEAAKMRYPHLAQSFSVCSPQPKENAFYGFAENVAVITAIQSLYYLSDQDIEECMEKFYQSMNPGGVFFATMMSERSEEFFQNSKEYKDGLREVSFHNDRIDCQPHYISFIKDEEHLKQKFKMFKPVHIGWYAAKFRNDEGSGHHFTFCGVK